MREYRIQCETDPMPAGQQPIGSAHTPNPVTSSPHDLQGACPLACNGTANNPQSSTVARSHSMELATEPVLPRWVCVLVQSVHRHVVIVRKPPDIRKLHLRPLAECSTIRPGRCTGPGCGTRETGRRPGP